MAFLFATTYVNASSKCSVDEIVELNHEVVNIKATYEEIEEEITDLDEYPLPDAVLGTPEEDEYVGYINYFKINLTNLGEKFYAVITNDYNREKITLKYKDIVDGVASFKWEHLDKVVNFTIKIYTSTKTGCEGELYRTMYLKTPRYNGYSEYGYCNNAKDYYLCQKYVTFDNISMGEFVQTLDKYYEKNKEAEPEKSFFEKYKIAFIVGGVLVVALGATGAFVIIKKRGGIK